MTAAILVPVMVFQFPAPLRAGVRLRDLFSVLNHPMVWLFGVIMIFESGSENCLFVWSGKIATDVLHTALARGGMALVALAAALGIGAWRQFCGCDCWETRGQFGSLLF